MEDGEGREIDFRNTIILLTSNAATDTLMKLCADPETMPDSDGILKALKPELNKIFKPAFLGRLLIVPYFPVRDEALKQIIRLKLGKIQKRLMETHKITLDYDDALMNEVAARCTEVESGARNVDNILSNTMLPDLSRQILTQIAAGAPASRVSISVKDSSLTYAWDAALEQG
jgi:type VI secretion system protein VasG